MKELARAQLSELVARYKAEMTDVNRAEISEETIRTWLNEFLGYFGWNVQNTNQVLQEHVLRGKEEARLDEISSPHKKPDYILRNGTNIKTFLDAKALNVNIFSDRSAAYQIRCYGWSAQSPCAFLSNFEQLVIFDTRHAPNVEWGANVGARQFSIDDYIDNFDTLYDHLWRENVWNNHLSELYETTVVEGVNQLDSAFMSLLSDFRVKLARNIIEHNEGVIHDDSMLNYYVQVILDRIIFIRVCESKSIETSERLRHFFDNPSGFWNSFKQCCYMEFYQHYDGAMFERDERFQQLEIDDVIFADFISKLYYPYPYKFDVIPVKVIAKIYEEFLGKQIVNERGEIKEKYKPEYVQVNGAISTPEHIVEIICKKTLSITEIQSIEQLLNIKILDPCCGSGVFLVCCYDMLCDTLKHILATDRGEAATHSDYFFVQDEGIYLTLNGRRAVASNCLHGIDCDDSAIEVAKMSIALQIVDCDTPALLRPVGVFGDMILRDISRNIKLGNTLVDTDATLSPEATLQVKPFCIRDTFENVFANNDGFDYIVGNPPYVETKHFKLVSSEMHAYLSTRYLSFAGKADLAVLFIERSLGLLNDNGKLGLIVQRRWYKTDYGAPTRDMIDSGKHKYRQIDFRATDIFPRRITYVSLLVLSKAACEEFEYSYISENATEIKTLFENSDAIGIYEGYRSRLIANTGLTNEAWSYESYEVKQLNDTLRGRVGMLADYPGLHVKDGIQALWKKIYHLTNVTFNNGIASGRNGFGETVFVEEAALKSVIYNEVFYPFKDVAPDAYCIFPYNGNSTDRLSYTYIRNNMPLLYEYLRANRDRIQRTVRCRNSEEYWHTFTREHNHHLYESNKIIIPMTAKDTIATYVSGRGLYMDNANVWFITVDGASDTLMKAIACIINSTVYSVLAKAGANPQSGGYYKFNKQFLTPVAFPCAAVTEDAPDVARLARLYDEIFDLQETWLNNTPARREVLEGVIENRWDALDSICERLYSLTQEEKELINGVGRTVSRTDLLNGVN